MKKFYEGKIYDTEKSTFVANCWIGRSSIEEGYESVNLYKTVKGRFFVVGLGRDNKNNIIEEFIETLSKKQAIEWCEDLNDYEKSFIEGMEEA